MSYSPNEPGTPLLPAQAQIDAPEGQAPFQTFFPADEIQFLLSQPDAVGLRVHYTGYISPTPLIAVAARMDTTEIYDSAAPAYVKVNAGYTERLSRNEFEAYLPSTAEDNAQYYCAFFSQSLLTDILNPVALSPDSGVLFLPGTHDQGFAKHPTLIAVAGNNQEIITGGTFFRSELPCPPHCGGGTDYGSNWSPPNL